MTLSTTMNASHDAVILSAKHTATKQVREKKQITTPKLDRIETRIAPYGAPPETVSHSADRVFWTRYIVYSVRLGWGNVSFFIPLNQKWSAAHLFCVADFIQCYTHIDSVKRGLEVNQYYNNIISWKECLRSRIWWRLNKCMQCIDYAGVIPFDPL